MFQATYFDGVSARAQAASVTVNDNAIEVDIGLDSKAYKLSELNIQAKLGSTKRLIDLPDGSRLEAIDISELEKALPSKKAMFWSSLHYLENHLGWVFVALFITVLTGWAFLQYGVPKLAEVVANATPPDMELKLGEQVLKGLDHKLGYFTASKTTQAQQGEIKTALAGLCQVNDCPDYRLEFRNGGIIGANAFALPGGIMVVTDDLIKLAKNNTEIVAVLAHELGHVKKRHAFRQSIQGTLSGLILAAATGDVSSLASGLPAVLVQMQYSRQHELEADAFALAALKQSCIPPRAFAEILYRLQNQSIDGKPDNKDKSDVESPKDGQYDPLGDILSTHPDTLERIRPFMVAEPNC